MLMAIPEADLERHAAEERVELPRAKVAADVENKTVGPGFVVLTEPRHAAVGARRALRRERPVALERDLDTDGRHAVGRIEYVRGERRARHRAGIVRPR